MVTEIRHLIFENEEVQQALTDFQRHRKKPLPPGIVMELKFWAKPEVGCSMEWIPIGQRERRSRVFSADELGAALIHHCISQKIPLPAKSPKVLQVFGGSIGLTVTVDSKKKVLPPAKPARASGGGVG